MSSFDIDERGKALALFFGISGGLTAIGPILGGYLTQWTWRAIFWVNLPVAAIAIVLTYLAKVHTVHRREPIDYRGAVLIALGMGLSVLGFQQSSSWGWGSAATWACIVAGLVILAVFVMVELRTKIPLIKVRIFRSRAFTVDNGVLFFGMIAFVPVFFFASVYSQISLGYDANNAGLYLLVFFAGFATAAQIGGRILDSRGAKPAIVAGTALGAIGFGLWGHSLTTLNLSAQWVYIVISGAGIGLLLGPASTDAVNRSIGASYGEVTGITQTLRNYGSSLGLAILGALLITVNTNKLTDSLGGLGIPADQAKQIAASISRGNRSGGFPAGTPDSVKNAILSAIQHDYAQATRVVFYGMVVTLAIAFVIALFHPAAGSRRCSADASPDPAVGTGVA